MKHFYYVTIIFLFFISSLHADNHLTKKGYVVAFLDIQNKEIMSQYRKHVKPIVQEYRGKLLSASPPDFKEGYIAGLAAIIEFPSFDDAKKWYDSEENQYAKIIRDKGVKTILLILEGK